MQDLARHIQCQACTLKKRRLGVHLCHQPFEARFVRGLKGIVQ